MKPRVGISACLAGQQVRFNASSLKHSWVDQVLSKHVEFVPFCPEMVMKLGAPREALRLVKVGDGIQLREVNGGRDLTEEARAASKKIIDGLPQVDAYIFAAKSPTCGLDRVKVYTEGVPFNDGVGLFAEQLTAAYPELLVIDSGRLHNEELREIFLKGLFTVARFNRINLSRSALQEFHRQHKFSLLAHHPDKMRALGRIAAANIDISEQFKQYKTKLCELLRVAPTRGGIINALEHMYGYLKHEVFADQKQFFFRTLEKYRAGELTATVPLKLLEMLQAGHPNAYLSEQIAWQPVKPLEVEHVI